MLYRYNRDHGRRHREGGCGSDVSPPVRNSGRDVPQKSLLLQTIFGILAIIFGFSNISKIKWAKSKEKLEFVDRWF